LFSVEIEDKSVVFTALENLGMDNVLETAFTDI